LCLPILVIDHKTKSSVVSKEIKSALHVENQNSDTGLVLAVGALRNLSIGSDSVKIRSVEDGIGDSMIAVCWLCEGQSREKAIGTLCNLSASQVASKLLIKSGTLKIGIGFCG
jgi:hypothetical protein